jgi:predicted nucleic-acid-binding Zn-ribbon protein
MAMSSCPKCGENRFELAENSPAGSKFKFMFVQCAGCGTVLGVLDYYNVGDMLQEQK